ncbi:MAG: hypothetical protein M1479_01265 [Actinobacteria bacterium]|nr:hypothetical protein [Cyanobacteriota bacterium]MCL5770893.1 hypothetical protein [Actinomycetota bacterium]
MKLSLDTIGYGSYFTRNYKHLSPEKSIKRVSKFGYDAVCIFTHKLLGFPIDFDSDRRKKN